MKSGDACFASVTGKRLQGFWKFSHARFGGPVEKTSNGRSLALRPALLNPNVLNCRRLAAKRKRFFMQVANWCRPEPIPDAHSGKKTKERS